MKHEVEQSEEGRFAGLDTLLRERLPARDLWAGIEARMNAQQAVQSRRSRLGLYALAASVSVAVLAGVLLHEHSPVDHRASGLPTMAVATLPADVSTGLTPYSNIEDVERSSTAISARALRTLRSESLDNAPALVAERADGSGLMKATYSASTGRSAHSQQAILRANLKLVSQAEREVRRALRSDPESASLQRLLNVAQDKRAALTNLLVHEQD